ncbi:hypothetical protein LS66_007285 [Helicobacter sp. MIT 03-1614]|uniref:outer membrane beta-barrel protein n=1 Tax=Helicobacter sp. MIT 03-1614 TaxID=1548147 RepID=UPI0006920BB8|nr:outer membrane beta-barrel protein [Helicobacter sp. MIT 03-1614]TLD87696.1 hypothetical protein LS66_007285 [Helicobacter sp. MIT 03-1614]
MKFRIFALSLCLPFVLCAKPVSIDEIFTPKKQFKILGSFSYVNVMRKNSAPALISIPSSIHGVNNIGDIKIPFWNHENVNQDYLSFSLQARYGISKRVEIFSTLNAFWQKSITDDNAGNFNSSSNGDFSSFSLGFLAEAKREGKMPSLLVGGSAEVIDNTYFSSTQKSLQYGKSYSLFATSFYTIDPIVFLLQAGLGLNLPKYYKNIKIDNGETFSLSPIVYFAVNPYVSLNFGVRYNYQSRDKLNNETISYTGSSLGYTFGIAYEIKSKLILFADVERMDTHNFSSNAINVSLSYRI